MASMDLGPIPARPRTLSGFKFHRHHQFANGAVLGFSEDVVDMIGQTQCVDTCFKGGVRDLSAGGRNSFFFSRGGAFFCSTVRRSTRSTNWIRVMNSSGVTGRPSLFLASTSSTIGIFLCSASAMVRQGLGQFAL